MINKASRHPEFKDHPGLARYGIESYIAVPLKRRNGEVFGTLCALDPEPSVDLDDKLDNFHLLADLISYQLEAEESSDDRERFLGVLAHDLRDPVHAISLTAHALLEMPDTPPPVVGPMQRILRSTRRIESMIGDLLDFARGRFGTGLAIDREPVDATNLVRSVVEDIGAGHPGRELRFEASGDFVARWDHVRMTQVVSNLTRNALAHGSDDRPVTVHIGLTDGDARLEVHNYGPPIPPEVQTRIFRPFSRAAETAAGSRSGLGLGLYIAAQVVEAHGGEIAVVSNAADGTRFIVTLPL